MLSLHLEVDWNESFLCLTVTQLVATLPFQIIPKVHYLQHFFINYIKSENIFTAAEARFLQNASTQS